MSVSNGDGNMSQEEKQEEDKRQHEKREGLSDGQKKIIVVSVSERSCAGSAYRSPVVLTSII